MDERQRREIHLPPEVIHHIQSFLTGEQAAQSALISNSWLDAWLTCPNFSFKESRFNRRSAFMDFVNKIIERYEEGGLNITSFNLDFKSGPLSTSQVVTDLIKKVLEFCADGTDSNIRFYCFQYVLPAVVRESETIAKLSVEGFMIDKPPGKVEFSKITSLSLTRMRICDDLFVGTFPCLKDLTIVRCRGSQALRISNSSLECINIVETRASVKIHLHVPNIHKFIFSCSCFPLLVLKETPTKWESDISVVKGPNAHCERFFLKMKSLLRKLSNSLCKVSIDVKWHGNILIHSHEHVSKTIPKIENLTLFTGSELFDRDILLRSLFECCHPKFITQHWFPKSCKPHEKENNGVTMFLYERLIKTKAKYAYAPERCDYLDGLADEVRVEIFEEAHGEWRPLDWKIFLVASMDLGRKRKIRFRLSWK